MLAVKTDLHFTRAPGTLLKLLRDSAANLKTLLKCYVTTKCLNNSNLLFSSLVTKSLAGLLVTRAMLPLRMLREARGWNNSK